jgi:hypothetical protein
MHINMTRLVSFVMVIFLALPLLSGCAKKPVWQPLWTNPPAGLTPETTPTKDPNATLAPEDYFATEVDSMDNPSVVITKSKHILEVYDGETLMARMKVSLGRTEGAKKRSGDNKTPEGSYFICSVSDTGKYYKSLFLSYPNSDDAYAGLEEKLIDQEQYDEIVSDIDRRQQPLWDTKLGSEIAISGTGTAGQGKTGNDWTAGNIVVSDKDMDYLWEHIATTGTDVQINP